MSMGLGLRFTSVCWLALQSIIACAPAKGSQPPADGASANAEAGGGLAERVAAAIHRQRPGTKIQILGPLDLKVFADSELQVHLGNLDSECQQAPDSCDGFIERFSRAVVAKPEPVTVESLRPVLKNQAWVTHSEELLSGKGTPTRFVVFPLIDDLRVVLVQDTPLATRPLSDEDLASLGLDREKARERAFANLAGAVPGFRVKEVKPGLFALADGGGYDAALMLFHAQWAELQERVRGDLVVAPIGRDIVLFTGTQNEDAFKLLLAIIEAERTEPSAAYPITTALYRWEPDGWKRHTP